MQLHAMFKSAGVFWRLRVKKTLCATQKHLFQPLAKQQKQETLKPFVRPQISLETVKMEI